MKNLVDMWINDPSYNRELEAIRRLVDKVGGEVPIKITVYSPLTILDKLTKGKSIELVRSGKDQTIRKALEKIAEVHYEYCAKAIELGADGLYLASQMGSYDKLTKDEYEEFGVPYDLEVLKAGEKGWFNSIHAHGKNVMFDLYKDYPVQIFNWHAYESLPTVAEVFKYTDMILNAGISRDSVLAEDKNAIRYQIFETYRATGGYRLLLSPSCGIRVPFNEDMIDYIKEVKEETEKIFLR